MIASAWDETELLALFARVCDGLADAAEMEQLGERLENDSRARQLWLEYADIHGGVAMHLDRAAALVDWPAVFAGGNVRKEEGEGGRAKDEIVGKSRSIVALALALSRFARRYPVISCTAAAVVLSLGITLMWLVALPERGPRLADGASDPKFVARLSNAFKPQWADGQIGGAIGSHLQAGHPYRLNAGMAEITFRSGARVVLEGPAEFRIASANSGKLFRGKLAAFVPQQARGFVVETERGRVIDLGTRFAIDLSQKGRMELHCFHGEIAFETPKYEKLRLTAGQAIEDNGHGQMRIAASASGFVHDLRLRGDLKRDGHGLVIDSRFSNNMALGKKATQSSTLSSYNPELAVDGDPTNFTHTATRDNQAWLMIDLGESHDIDAVVLHNRDDCCGDRLRDVVVEVLADDGKQVVFASPMLNEKNQMSSPPLVAIGLPELTGDLVRGRFVRIRRIASPGESKDEHTLANLRALSLGEVQIFATPVAPMSVNAKPSGGQP